MKMPENYLTNISIICLFLMVILLGFSVKMMESKYSSKSEYILIDVEGCTFVKFLMETPQHFPKCKNHNRNNRGGF